MIARQGGAAGLAAFAALLGGCGDGAAPETPGNEANAVAPAPAVSVATRDEVEAPQPNAAAPAAAEASAAPCLMQDGKPLDLPSLRALGTEPFWGARIKGRCVTYSHPDDQQGTRIWTRYAPRPGGGTWSGSLGGKPFVLSTRAQPGCSDGMSDKTYPMAVELVVQGEKRSGCAEAAS